MTNNQNRIYVVMGVSGSGKSAVAAAAARQLSAGFLDGDFLHPRSNILKMAAGEALNDDDRAPWLAALNDAAFAMQRTNNVSIIVCSALKSSIATACAPATATCRSSICTASSR